MVVKEFILLRLNIQKYSDYDDSEIRSHFTTVNARYLNVKLYRKLLISVSKFSGPRKFTLRYQQFEIIGVEL